MGTITTLILLFILMIILIFLSGWFSGSETALTNLSVSDIAMMKRKGLRNAGHVMKLKKNMEKTLITLLIGNNVVNIILSSVAALIANALFAEIGVSIMIGVITFLITVFGEITPKNSAIHDSVKVANRNGFLIHLLTILLTPVTLIFGHVSRGFIRLTGGRIRSEHLLTSDDSIKEIADLMEDEGNIKAIERDIIHRVFKFGDRKVKDVMVPMKDVFILDDGTSLEEVKGSISSRGFTRVPIMGDGHRVRGILYSKDLLMAKDTDIPSLIRKPFIVREEDEITDVFERMRSERIHMAIVMNDKKEHAGIVTLEDILEEIVGEVEDEYFRTKYSTLKLN
ncbi:MAG: hemolysin family protein [Candidatus Thermoplasmatota archaeon]|nr:hemolysin family protein [Candidatus Thermoplasmatota archaeon]